MQYHCIVTLDQPWKKARQHPIKQQSVSSTYSAIALELMNLVSQQWRLELAWAQRLRERIVATQALWNSEEQLNGGNEHVH